MVTLPKGFVATQYPGYFWHLTEHRLYSIKVSGMLQPLRFDRSSVWNNWLAGYRVSVNGRRRLITPAYLMKLKDTPQVIEVWPGTGETK